MHSDYISIVNTFTASESRPNICFNCNSHANISGEHGGKNPYEKGYGSIASVLTIQTWRFYHRADKRPQEDAETHQVAVLLHEKGTCSRLDLLVNGLQVF